MFWHLRMILAYKKTLGKFPKVLGGPPLGKIPKKSRFFLLGASLMMMMMMMKIMAFGSCQ